MNIEHITVDTIEPCAELFVNVFTLPPWNENWTKQQARERLEFYFNTPNFLGLQYVNKGEDNNIKGCFFGNFEPYQDMYLYTLTEMFIHPDVQGRGVGTQLITQLKCELKERNIELINLITKVGSQAEDFYLKNGFHKSKSMGLYVSKMDLA